MRLRALLVILWGVGGTAFVLAEAIWRLGMLGIGLVRAHGLTAGQGALLAGWTLLICYAEGYRGFQQRFSPRVVARALYLADHPRPLHVLLAPLYCMALLHATRRRLIASWVLVAGIVAIVILVRLLPPIYRAIVDLGVACALTWGTVSMLAYLVRGLSGAAMPVPPDVPEPAFPDTARSPGTV